jgi:hypothetical protein
MATADANFANPRRKWAVRALSTSGIPLALAIGSGIPVNALRIRI